jgi:hypothetical protein
MRKIFRVSSVFIDIDNPLRPRHLTEYYEAKSLDTLLTFFSMFTNLHIKRVSLVHYINTANLKINILDDSIDYTKIKYSSYIYELMCKNIDESIDTIVFPSNKLYDVDSELNLILNDFKIYSTDVLDILSAKRIDFGI